MDIRDDDRGFRPARPPKAQPITVVVYKAIADESGGTIQVKRVNADGSVTGDAITLRVLP